MRKGPAFAEPSNTWTAGLVSGRQANLISR
ncbi:hypothetical protein N184_19755 [Sinorhizobium sp. GL28]|nr:hypothetical protein N183_07785 [Sinorhizobium sp. Sb3]KSV93937.1 hypothetical protein N184_19755 [Sinorhizobium sp. GL28]